MKVKSKSEVAQSCPDTSRPPWTAAHQAPLPMGFSRQEYWNGLPLPSPESYPKCLLKAHPSRDVRTGEKKMMQQQVVQDFTLHL